VIAIRWKNSFVVIICLLILERNSLVLTEIDLAEFYNYLAILAAIFVEEKLQIVGDLVID